ncbi:hypothetical protein ND748_11830 [Frankia sp. AiPs1]|uniref:hypothetical protein n=1 Tax=Frankia sp. AiPs1 TaxID=573493 RepID=UPI0020433275|nr:hypothetical protein [Frankia sp. AiPs1]MCM3922345.1 hypothetical protein [Frankia sp. AiPs1]
MTVGADESAGWVARCHLMLLWIAGFVPDDMLTACRAWLAQGRVVDVALTVAQQAGLTGVELYREDVELLVEIRRAAGIAVPPEENLALIDVPPTPPYRFGPDRSASPTAPAGRSAAAGGVDAAVRADGVLGALLDAIRADFGSVRAAWLAWRRPMENTRWPPPRRVFVVEVDEEADAPALAGHLQRVLAGAGDPDAGVEVYPVTADADLPTYQLWAREYGRRIHVRDARPPLRLVPFYDEVDGTERKISPTHPLLAGRERTLVLDYLRGADVVSHDPQLVGDILRPEAGDVVPTFFRTDGHWVWADPSWYYLLVHHLAPYPEFLADIRRRGYVLPPVDEVDRQRARELLESPEDSLGWANHFSTPRAHDDG